MRRIHLLTLSLLMMGVQHSPSARAQTPKATTPVKGTAAPIDVTVSEGTSMSVAVSPDGRTLAYVSRLAGGNFRLHTLDLAGGANGNILALSDTNEDESPSFAPNGKLIIYASRAQGRDVLMTSTLDGRIKTRLLSSGLDVREPVWGPFNR